MPSESGVIAAARAGDTSALHQLLDAGASADAVDPRSTLSALMFAAGRGSADCVALLLERGAAVNLVDSSAGGSALHKACQGGHVEVTRMLLDAGAWLNQQTATTGHTPLIEAIWFKSVETVRLLIERNARIELTCYYGFTIDEHIDFALKVNTGARRERLLTIKAEVEARRAELARQRTSQTLHDAVFAKDLAAVEACLSAGCDVEQRLPMLGTLFDGYTPLLSACLGGDEAIVAALLQHGADVNAVDPVFGAVPLHKGTYNGHAGVVRQLVKAKGVELNFQGGSNGYTPLHDALWHGYADCAEILLDAGADTRVVAFDGMRAADLAEAELGRDHLLTVRVQAETRDEVKA